MFLLWLNSMDCKRIEVEITFLLYVSTGVLCSEPAPARGSRDAKMNAILCSQRAWLSRKIGSPHMNPDRARRKPIVGGGRPRTLLAHWELGVPLLDSFLSSWFLGNWILVLAFNSYFVCVGCFHLIAKNKHNNLPLFSEKTKQTGRFLRLSRKVKIGWETPQVSGKLLPQRRTHRRLSDPSPLSELQPEMNQPLRQPEITGLRARGMQPTVPRQAAPNSLHVVQLLYF